MPALIDGHVVDTAGKLSQDDIDALNRQMEATRLQSGYVIDALVVRSLDGASIDDVAYQTFQTWKPGDAKRDNGVLIVVAPNDRQDRIEVGKGVEGALTDLQTDDIRRAVIEPRLKQNDLRGALAAGADAIAKTLIAADAGQPAPAFGTRVGPAGLLFGGVFLVLILWVLVRSWGGGWGGRGGGGGWWFGGGGFGGGGGGGGFGGGGGGGFGGGGGSSGGGGIERVLLTQAETSLARAVPIVGRWRRPDDEPDCPRSCVLMGAMPRDLHGALVQPCAARRPPWCCRGGASRGRASRGDRRRRR